MYCSIKAPTRPNRTNAKPAATAIFASKRVVLNYLGYRVLGMG